MANPECHMNKVFEFLSLPKYKLKEYKKYFPSQLPNLKMKKETRKDLEDYFRPHNKKLEMLLGRKVPWDY